MRLQELRYVKDKYGRQYQHEVGNRALQISSDVSNLICTCFAPLQGFTTMYVSKYSLKVPLQSSLGTVYILGIHEI